MVRTLRLTLLLIISIVGCNTYSQYTDVINSNRPGESFGAYSVGNTIFQIEGGLSYIHEKQKASYIKAKGLFADLDIRYGFWREELEFITELQYQNDRYRVPGISSTRRSFMKTTTFGFKYLVYDPFKGLEEEEDLYSWKEKYRFKWRQFIPAVAVYAGFNLNSSDNPYVPQDQSTWTPKAMIVLQNHFSGGWVFVTNLIINHISSEYQTVGGILTSTKSFDEKWSGFAEIQGYSSDYYKDIIFRGGAAYLFNENVQFDASFGKNFSKTTNIIYGGIGVSWRFTLNYKDLRIYKIEEAEEDIFSGRGASQEDDPDQLNGEGEEGEEGKIGENNNGEITDDEDTDSNENDIEIDNNGDDESDNGDEIENDDDEIENDSNNDEE